MYNPVTLSVLAYAHWNPLKFIDPDGNDILWPVSYRWSNSGDAFHKPKNPYLIATYAVYGIDVSPAPNFVPSGNPIATFEMAYEARMTSKAKGKANVLGDTPQWVEVHNVWEYKWGTKYQFGIMGYGKGKTNTLTTVRDGKTIKWEGIRFHPGGPYFSEGCTSCPDPAFLKLNPSTKKDSADNAKWGEYVKRQIPSLRGDGEPTYLYLPDYKVNQNTPRR